MVGRFIVRPLAEADLEEAARWYDDERPGLAARFLSDVQRAFARIRERPTQFPTVSRDAASALAHLPICRVLPGVARDGRRARRLASEKKPEGVARPRAVGSAAVPLGAQSRTATIDAGRAG